MDSILKYDEEIVITTDFLSEDRQINYNQFGVPFITENDLETQYYLLGITHAKDRILQLDYKLSTALGLYSERYDSSKWKNDFIIRRLDLKTKAKTIFNDLDESNKVIYNNYSKGINDYILTQDAFFELQLFNIKPIKWEPYYPILLKLLNSIANNNKFNEFEDFKKLYKLKYIDETAFKSILDLAEIDNIDGDFYGLKSSYLNNLSDFFSDMISSSYYDLSFETPDTARKFLFFSQKGEIIKNNEAYLSIINNKLNLSIPGDPLSLCEINTDSIKHFQIYSCDLNFQKLEIDGDKIYVSDSIIKIDYKIDTIFNDPIRTDYILNNSDFNIINFKNYEKLLSIKPEFKLIANNSFEENIIIEERIEKLLNDVVKFTPIEMQLISNDNYSPYLNELKKIVTDKLSNYEKFYDNEEKQIINDLIQWECLVDRSNKNYIALNKIKNEIFLKIISFASESNNKTIDISNKTKDNIVINSLKKESKLFDNPKTKKIETSNEIVFEIFKSFNINDVSIEKTVVKSIEDRILKRSPYFFYKSFLPKGDQYSIRFYNSFNKISNLSNLIYESNTGDIYYQNFSGQSGNKLSKNYNDLFSIWKTGGFVRFNLNDKSFDNKLVIKSQ